MLTGLNVTAVIEEQDKAPQTFTFTYNALTLLSYMQQALPGVSPAPGDGSQGNPWRPTTPSQWFYCAKLKGSGSTAKRFPNLTHDLAWLEVGGRYIAVNPNDFYSSDWGTDGTACLIPKPTYPKLAELLRTWNQGNRATRTDAALTQALRKYLRGQAALDAPDALSVLASVLLVSEVARNHTAFHTNLMALDLIEQGAQLPDGTPWTWQNALWREDACQLCRGGKIIQCMVCRGGGGRLEGTCATCGGHGLLNYPAMCHSCGGSGQFRPGVRCRACGGTGAGYGFVTAQCNGCGGSGLGWVACGSCGGQGTLECPTCGGKGIYDELRPKGLVTWNKTLQGGSSALQNGLLPMSHTGSAFGSGFDLTGEGTYQTVSGGSMQSSQAPSPLFVVRRKEATVLIQWLQIVLDQSEIQFNSTQTLKLSVSVSSANLPLGGVDFSTVYDEVESRALAGRTLDDDKGSGSLLSEVMDSVRSKIVSYIQIRSETFMYAF